MRAGRVLLLAIVVMLFRKCTEWTSRFRFAMDPMRFVSVPSVPSMKTVFLLPVNVRFFMVSLKLSRSGFLMTYPFPD
jgi:hypothetical protein